MSRPASEASHAAATRLARSQSAKTNTAPAVTSKQQPPPPPPHPQHVRLFVANLRLLDLDLRDDWPNVSVHTFSARTADQKQRISGAEWALFRLFEIWDPPETAQVRATPPAMAALLTAPDRSCVPSSRRSSRCSR